MLTLPHRLMHWLRWNPGTLVTARDEKGLVWNAFRCSDCGRIDRKEISPPADRSFSNDGYVRTRHWYE